MKPKVMQLLVALRLGGAERLALNILQHGRSEFSGFMGGLFHEPGELAHMAQEEGFPHLALRAEQSGRIRSILCLRKALREQQITLLHVQAAYTLPYAVPAARLAGVPLFYTEHALHSLQRIRWLRAFVKLSAPMLRGIACVNEQVADFFTGTLGISPKKVTVISNGVDTDYFSPQGEKAELPFNNAGGNAPLFIFGNVSRLCEAKDHANLLRAFAKVRRERPEARLLLVGDGEKRSEIENLRDRLELNDFIRITGTSLNIPSLLRAMDAFVLSSRREGLPMAVLEAMACGLPVVSTDVGSLAELNKDGKHIRLVPPENDEALAAAMLAIINDGHARRDLAEKSRELVTISHSGAAMAKQYRDWYRDNKAL